MGSRFCEDSFWDWELTWGDRDRDATNRTLHENYYGPDLTACFPQTTLAWIPCLFLWLNAPWEIALNWSSGRHRDVRVHDDVLVATPTRKIRPKISIEYAHAHAHSLPWTPLNLSKFTLILLLLILQFLLVAHVMIPMHYDKPFIAVKLWTPVFRIFTLCLALFLFINAKFKGIQSSGIQFIFWFLMTLCEAPAFRTALIKPTGEGQLDESIDFLFEMVYFPALCLQLLLNCWADQTAAQLGGKDQDRSPEERASFLSRLTFFWFDCTIWKGYKAPLTFDDITTPNSEQQQSSRAVSKKFGEEWQKISKRGEVPSVLPALWRTLGPSFLFGTFLKFVQDCLVFVAPCILKWLVEFSTNQEQTWKGIIFAVLLFLTTTMQTFFLSHYFQRMYMVGILARNSIVSAIYQKALRVTHAARKESTVGEIVNLMSVDAQHIMELSPFVNLLWSAPFQITVAMYLLWTTLGWAVLSGVGLLVVLVPLNAWINSGVKKLQMDQMKNKDHRVKLMNEILSGIKLLKLYAWELSFRKEILQIRDKEMKVLKSSAYMESIIAFVMQCSPFVVALVTCATYVYADEKNVFDASKAFVALTLFNIMSTPLAMLPMVVSGLVKGQVSLLRLNKFLNSEEIDAADVTHMEGIDYPIVIQNATFSWENDFDTLRNINIHVKEGSLTAIVGSVGSGKTSMLCAMLGEIPKIHGHVNTKGSIAYVAQQPWIQCASLQDNVLFGKGQDSAKYERVIEACALLPDLAILPAGDKTQIGEKGINLSGGQKQRVALARVAYSNADVYLLDDPFSAVDPHVGKHIFEKLVGPEGLLKHKTRVLVTHGLAYLSQVDQIIVMKDGEISEVGTYAELMANKGDFFEFLEQYHSGNDKPHSERDTDFLKVALGRTCSTRSNGSYAAGQRRTSVHSVGPQPQFLIGGDILTSPNDEEPPADLVEAETTETGNVKFSVYLHYIKSVGVFLVPITMTLQVISQGFAMSSNIWLAEWSSQPLINGTQDSSKRGMYIGVYATLGVGQAFFLVLGSTSMAIGMSSASDDLHGKMLTRILRAPMWFFDSTPVGRIVNRFGKDIDICDSVLPINFRDFLFCFFNVIATMIVICYSIPAFLVIFIPIFIAYYFIQKLYVTSSRQLKRMESVSRSPLFSHFSETITGVSTIRAFGVQAWFAATFDSQILQNQNAYFHFVVANRWLGVRLEAIANLIIFFAALFGVLEGENMEPGFVGLAVSYALQITATLNWVVRMSAALETNIVAVERIKEYTEVPQEPENQVEERHVNEEWPDKATVYFDRYRTGYRTGTEFVLKDISCKIEAGEKIGIVGRTGSGKSSLTMALFRIIEPKGGTITIGGEDISTLSLHDLRSRLTIIPQDPILFSGSLRLNLDPFHSHDDAEIWRVLESANLKYFIKGLPGGLLYEVSEGGENLSVGQRQQICLARALLRKTKILVLDEATASVDLETDDLIQRTIREEFAGATVLTIAHRLNTIMDSTRIMVLDKGVLKEFAKPCILLSNKNSLFYQMTKDAGLV